jgi:Ca-activated chloride channel family protein
MFKELARERRALGDVRRQAIVVFSDGDDTSSIVSFDDLRDVARQAGVAIYTITLKDPAPPHLPQSRDVGTSHRPQIEFAMRALAKETGGRAFFPSTIDALAGIYDGIAAELAHQYIIGYTSKNPQRDGAYRHVQVRVTERSELQARARAGYVSGRADSAPSIR